MIKLWEHRRTRPWPCPEEMLARFRGRGHQRQFVEKCFMHSCRTERQSNSLYQNKRVSANISHFCILNCLNLYIFCVALLYLFYTRLSSASNSLTFLASVYSFKHFKWFQKTWNLSTRQFSIYLIKTSVLLKFGISLENKKSVKTIWKQNRAVRL